VVISISQSASVVGTVARSSERRRLRLNGYYRRYAIPIPPDAFTGSSRKQTGPDAPRQDFRRDGWVSRQRYAVDLKIGLKAVRSWYQNNQVDWSIAENVYGSVAAWRSRGVAVYGFRPPTSREVSRLTDELSGFDEARFVRRFREAGGIWIDVNKLQYDSYDGVHLLHSGAVKLSGNISAKIAAQ